MTVYDEDFYARQYEGSIRSATKFLSRLFDDYRPSSIIDFGCGVGSWLYAAEQLGVDQLAGLDGEWVSEQQLLSEKMDFYPVDFERVESFDRRCDLALSVEVAEHIDALHADRFVGLICSASDLVIFGAAIPFQGGEQHINEQPQSYWVDKFASHGFVCFDYFRPAFWNDSDIEYWYRQNTLLFVRSESLARYPFLGIMPRDFIVDVVHPELFARKRRTPPQRADVLRDAALELEDEDIKLAFLMMSKAAEARPEGPFIRRRLRAYMEQLSGSQAPFTDAEG